MLSIGGSVAVVAYQYSVVVKGIEKKLRDIGYNVLEAEKEIEQIKNYLGRAQVYIVYLPDDIVDDSQKLSKLKYVMGVIEESKRYAIFIGEKKFHEDMISAIPGIRDHIWVDRPIDMDVLSKKLKEYIDKPFEKVEVAVVENKHILIVDDDPSYAKMVREWLKSDYRIDIVTAGMQAITFLTKNHVDLVLLDYEMPVADGPQILGMLRSEPDTAKIPVVFLTGIGTKESIERVMSLKPEGYILKSTTREDLLKTLSGLFEKLSKR